MSVVLFGGLRPERVEASIRARKVRSWETMGMYWIRCRQEDPLPEVNIKDIVPLLAWCRAALDWGEMR